ncbi:hypothetical protein GQ54DRAFT_335555 [Martensiomyces pterosporus]|nr:hypothetical protein GQ54DRAFT_335555 [Martensiomyces pterosporus]
MNYYHHRQEHASANQGYCQPSSYEARNYRKHEMDAAQSAAHYPQTNSKDCDDSDDAERRIALTKGSDALKLGFSASMMALGGLVAGTTLLSNKEKDPPPPQPMHKPHQKPNNYPSANYGDYKPGQNPNAHLLPPSYTAYAQSSIVAHASSHTGSSNPSRPSKYSNSTTGATISSSTASATTSAAVPASAAAMSSSNTFPSWTGSSLNASSQPLPMPISPSGMGGKKKGKHTVYSTAAGMQIPASTAAATATQSTSYQAFDHSSAQHPSTHSVLSATNNGMGGIGAAASQAHINVQQQQEGSSAKDKKKKHHRHQDKPAGAGGKANSSDWLHDTAYASGISPTAAYYQQSTSKLQRQGVQMEAASVTNSEMVGDAEAAGFAGMPSKYSSKKSKKHSSFASSTILLGNPHPQVSNISYVHLPSAPAAVIPPRAQPGQYANQPQQHQYASPQLSSQAGPQFLSASATIYPYHPHAVHQSQQYQQYQQSHAPPQQYGYSHQLGQFASQQNLAHAQQQQPHPPRYPQYDVQAYNTGAAAAPPPAIAHANTVPINYGSQQTYQSHMSQSAPTTNSMAHHMRNFPGNGGRAQQQQPHPPRYPQYDVQAYNTGAAAAPPPAIAHANTVPINYGSQQTYQSHMSQSAPTTNSMAHHMRNFPGNGGKAQQQQQNNYTSATPMSYPGEKPKKQVQFAPSVLG